MAKLAAEGNVKVWKVPVIANKQAPSELEMSAGTNLTPLLPTAGVQINWTQNNTSTSMLDESFVTASVGTESAEIVLQGVRDDTSDDFFGAFDRGENFFLVVGRFGSADKDGDKVEVYPVQSHRPVPLTPAENEDQMASVTLAVNDTPELNAVIGGEGEGEGEGEA